MVSQTRLAWFVKRACVAACVVTAAVVAEESHAADAPAAAETIRLWTGEAPGALGTAEQDIPVVVWWPALIPR
jgi:hypothetical protein